MSLDEPAILPPGGDPQIVPGDKWIRGTLDGQTIVDSQQFFFVWEVPYWPWWFFPRSHINAKLTEQSQPHPSRNDPAGLVRYDLVCGDRVLPGAARAYPTRPYLNSVTS